MKTHQCSQSLICKSQKCRHAKPHEPSGCDLPACCGCWPNDPHYKPRVVCKPFDQVKPRADCPHCGAKEADGHHHMSCIAVLKSRVASLESKLKDRAFLEQVPQP